MKESNRLNKKRKLLQQYKRVLLDNCTEHYFIPFYGDIYCLVDNNDYSAATKDELELIKNISNGNWTLLCVTTDKKLAENMMLTTSHYLGLCESKFLYHTSGSRTLTIYSEPITIKRLRSMEGKPMYTRKVFEAKDFFNKNLKR